MNDISKILKMASLFEALASEMSIEEAEKILNLHKGYDFKKLKSAYRMAIFKNHPDKNPNKTQEALEETKRINKAYARLKDLEFKNEEIRYNKPTYWEDSFGDQEDPYYKKTDTYI